VSIPTHEDVCNDARAAFNRLTATELPDKGDLQLRSPITGGVIATVASQTPDEIAAVVAAARDAYLQWRTVPAPVRGAFVRELAELLREHKNALADLVTIEAGKIRSEALGEVQEMIDVCDLAVGLSRQLHGLTILHSPEGGEVGPRGRLPGTRTHRDRPAARAGRDLIFHGLESLVIR